MAKTTKKNTKEKEEQEEKNVPVLNSLAGMNGKNRQVATWIVVISFLFLIPGVIWSNAVLNLLSHLGAAGLAASITAIIIENQHNKENDNNKTKEVPSDIDKIKYFSEINYELDKFVGRLIWYERRLYDANFDWWKDIEYYNSTQFKIDTCINYQDHQEYSYKDILSVLNQLYAKYSVTMVSMFSPAQKQTINRMQQIIFNDSLDLLKAVDKIDRDKQYLDAKGYMNLKESETLIKSIRMSLEALVKYDSCFQVYITYISGPLKTIKTIGNYSEKIKIGVFNI